MFALSVEVMRSEYVKSLGLPEILDGEAAKEMPRRLIEIELCDDATGGWENIFS